MRNRLSLIAIIGVASALVLTGCAGESEPDADDTTTATDDSTTAAPEATDPAETTAPDETEAPDDADPGELVMPDCDALIPSNEIDVAVPGAALAESPIDSFWSTLVDTEQILGEDDCYWATEDESAGIAIVGALLTEDGVATVEQLLVDSGTMETSEYEDATLYSATDDSGDQLLVNGSLIVYVAGTADADAMQQFVETAYGELLAANPQG